MSNPDNDSNLPVNIAAGLAGIPQALIPASLKALDRLIGATVDIPVAWLNYQKAKIESKTEAFRTVDAAITQSAAKIAGGSQIYAERALDQLVRKSYRQLENKEAVSVAMLEDLRGNPSNGSGATDSEATQTQPTPIDDDWLNVFERYAEDASTERMQKLWGRVLAGEVRTPGRYAMRTLRFLSEFSQADALSFSLFCEHSFGDIAPKSLAIPENKKDIRDILNLEAAGLVQGSSGLGLTVTKKFNEAGIAFMREGPLGILFYGVPETSFVTEVVSLTPLGNELVTLLPNRDPRAAARAVALAMRTPEIKSAYLALVGDNGRASAMEVLWQEDAAAVSDTTS